MRKRIGERARAQADEMSRQAVILAPSRENIARVAESLRAGGIAAMPTETVYGLAGSAFSGPALARIFEAKHRPTFDPLIVHVPASASSLSELERLGLVDPSRITRVGCKLAELLMASFWPGPLTLVMPRAKTVPDLATSGLPRVGVRMPRHAVAQELLAACGFPLAAPSANRFGRISPTRAEDVLSELGDRIQWILDGGPCEVGLESTVIGIEEDGGLSLLRPGGISAREIRDATGVSAAPATGLRPGAQVVHPTGAQVVHPTGAQVVHPTGAQDAPGMLESHYAPSKPLTLLPSALASLGKLPHSVIEGLAPGDALGLLAFSGDARAHGKRLAALTSGRPAVVRVLSPSGSLSEAAQNLFSELRFLDGSLASRLLAEPCPESEGLGHAIRDRLERASARRS